MKTDLADRVIALAREMKEIRTEMDALDEAKKPLTERYDAIRFAELPTAIEEAGISRMSIHGVGTVFLYTDVNAKILDKERAMEWMRDNGYGDLVTVTVNGSTLKAWAKERLTEGEELPVDLFSVKPFEYAKILNER